SKGTPESTAEGALRTKCVMLELMRTLSLPGVLLLLTTTRSGRPSPLKSPTAIPLGPEPTLKGGCASKNVPSPLPIMAVTLLLLLALLDLIKSTRPSRLKSATTNQKGLPATGIAVGVGNVPPPLFKTMVTRGLVKLA